MEDFGIWSGNERHGIFVTFFEKAIWKGSCCSSPRFDYLSLDEIVLNMSENWREHRIQPLKNIWPDVSLELHAGK